MKVSLEKLKSVRVFVLGDYFLDHYYYGSVARVSPEAPVPVLNVLSEKDVPGGAANVVNNLCALGCSVSVFGAIGEDVAGNILTKLLSSAGADTAHLIQHTANRTIIKSRAVGNRSQIVRLDFNDGQPPSETSLDLVLHAFNERVDSCDIAVLSDYGKGFCSPEVCRSIIQACHERRIPVIIDPKGTDWERYRGAAWITPNFSEFAAVVGKSIKNDDDDIASVIEAVAENSEIGNVLVTRAEKGMTLYQSGSVCNIPAAAREVYDVSGAGDTVVAVLSALLGLGADARDAAAISNLAAGIVIKKAGTATVTRTELEAALRVERMDRVASKIMDWDTLFSFVASWKSSGETIAVTNGCFDIFHKGHASLIQAASKLGDRLIVAINADETVRKLKGEGRPINSEDDRAYVIASLECVDAVVIFGEDTPEELLSHIRPDVLAKGGEYTLEQVPGRQFSKRVELVNYIDGYSTTSIVNKVREG